MNISNIIYYTRPEDAITSTTLSLRNLNLREGFELEDIFRTVAEATDTVDLLFKFRRLVHESIEFESENPGYIRFTVYDLQGNTNYLKFRLRKEM